MSERALETKVGFFLLLGLAIMATMVIVFGRFEESFKPTYTITIKFTNAEGLIKGTTVTLAGSPIGRIKDYPHPVLDDGVTKIAVTVRIDKSIEIHRDAHFRIVSVGILGNTGIDVQPRRLSKEPSEVPPLLEDGDMVEGESSGGGLADLSGSFTDLGITAKPAIQQIHELATSLTTVSNRVNTEVLTPETVTDLKESIKKLRSILTRVDGLLASAQEGKGPLARLLNDPKMADDLSSLIYNLRHRGVLFYSDVAAQEKAEKGKTKP